MQIFWGFFQCCMVLGICFCGCGVCVCQSEYPFCQFWCETHTKGLHMRFPHETRRWWWKEGLREKRRNQSTEQSRTKTGQSTEVGGEAAGQRKTTARTSGLRGQVGQREMISQRSWWLCGNFTRILCSSIASQNARKVSQIFALVRTAFDTTKPSPQFLRPIRPHG